MKSNDLYVAVAGSQVIIKRKRAGSLIIDVEIGFDDLDTAEVVKQAIQSPLSQSLVTSQTFGPSEVTAVDLICGDASGAEIDVDGVCNASTTAVAAIASDAAKQVVLGQFLRLWHVSFLRLP